MFDIDGTLVQSIRFDEVCFVEAIFEATGVHIDQDWSAYPNVTDSGLIAHFFSHQYRRVDAAEQASLTLQIKRCFEQKIQAVIDREGVMPVAGAVAALSALRGDARYRISIATGGWGSTAKLKLQAAGLAIEGLALASACDHQSRADIMATALQRAGGNDLQKIIYFGDGPWDVSTCQTVGCQLILVGQALSSSSSYLPTIKDFTDLFALHAMLEQIDGVH